MQSKEEGNIIFIRFFPDEDLQEKLKEACRLHNVKTALSLTGNISKQDGDYILHLHVVLGNEEKNTVGGHLIEGKVEVTNEIVLLKTDMNIKRKIEEKTGLKGMFVQ